MNRRVVNLTLDTLPELPADVRQCIQWELDPVDRGRQRGAAEAERAKEQWVSETLRDWGSCGKVIQCDGSTTGFISYAPAAYVPRAAAFPSGPVSADAVLLMTAQVVAQSAGSGIGRVLIQSAAKDLVRRSIRAIEVFGDLRPETGGCVLPAGFLLAVGFKTVRSHSRYPRLRMDLRSAITWREDVEVALERLLGSMVPEPGTLRPI